MIAALTLPTQAHALLTILGEGALFFLVFLIAAVELGTVCAVFPWTGKAVSTKRCIAFCGLFTAVWVLVAAAFAIKG